MLRQVAISGLMVFISALASATPPPAEAFGAVPRVHSVTIDPRGTRLAWAVVQGDDTRVVVHNLSDRKETSFPVPDRLTLADLHWSDDTTLLLSVEFTRPVGLREYENYNWRKIFAVNTDGSQARLLLAKDAPEQWVTAAHLISLRSRKPGTVMMTSFDFSIGKYREEIGSRISPGAAGSGWTLDLFEVDTASGKARTIAQGTSNTTEWILDESGGPVARSEWDAKKNRQKIFRISGNESLEIYDHSHDQLISEIGFDAPRNALLAVDARGSDHVKVWEIPLDGSGAKVRFESPDADVAGLISDPYSGAILGVELGGVRPTEHWFDSKAEARHRGLAKSFPDRYADIIARSADGTKNVVVASSPTSPHVYYLVDYAKRSADIIGESFPDLTSTQLAKVLSYPYRARDGREIPGYLTLPPNSNMENLPIVVLPHDGPEDRDHLIFDWIPQFLASRGYAVFQPQFRGSGGFGDEHRLAGKLQWGGLMQDDVSDGVAALIKEKIADPKRICIVGRGYGGYSALAGAAFTPDLYACAASINGITDLPEMLAYLSRKDVLNSGFLDYWREHIGSPQDPKVAARSPRRAVASITTPVLLLHGAKNTAVPPSQSESMARAMKAQNKTVTFIALEGSDHWLGRTTTRVRVLKELETFLAQHLGPVKH